MAFDAHSNFGYSNVAAPAPGLVGTQLIVSPGQGALFPAAPFNCTVWPAGVQPTAFNAEIVRVTAVVGDTLTITRTQEGSTTVNIEVGFQIANTTSRKVFTDIESACVISAGTQAATGPFTFADGNGVTFGMDNGTMTASVAPGGGGAAISAGGNSQSTGTVVFSNSNNITFGLNGAGILTASFAQTPQQAISEVFAGTEAANQAVSFVNSNGITFGMSNNSDITASYTVPSTAGLISFVNVSAGTTSNNVTALTFSNANGITFGMNGSVITASYVPGAGASINFSAGTTSSNLTAVTFANSNGVTFGLNGGTITASVTTGGITNINFSAGTTSNNLSAITFANSNGVTFGLDNGTVTASVNSAAGGNFTQSILMFPNPLGNNTTNQNYAGTNRIVVDPFVANSPISFNFIQMLVSASVNLNTASFSTTTTGAATYSVRLGIYSRSVTDSGATNFSNSSIVALVSSLLWTMQISTSGSSSSKGVTYAWQTDSTGGSSTQTYSVNSATLGAQAGGFFGRILFSPPWSMSLPAGEYWMARHYTSSNVNNATQAFIASFVEMTWNVNSTQLSSLGQTIGGGNLNGQNMPYPGLGFYSATNPAALPATFDLTNDISNSNIGQQGWRCYCLKP